MRALALLVLLVGLAGAAASAVAQTGQIAIDHAWARATPGNSEIGAAYATIRSSAADRLVAAATPVAAKAELHTVEMAGMVMKMRPVAGLDIPAGTPVSLKPGGYHIMLTGLVRPLRAGETFPLTLTFAKAGARTVTVAVEKVGAAGPPSAAGGR